jgi:HSP20 family molecular chaperone IbpA
MTDENDAKNEGSGAAGRIEVIDLNDDRWQKDFGGFADEWSPDWSPQVDLGETATEYLVVVQAPGVSRRDTSVELTGGALVVTVDRKRRGTDKKVAFSRLDRKFGSGRVAVRLPDDADGGGVIWKAALGLVDIHIPKAISSAVDEAPPDELLGAATRRLPEEKFEISLRRGMRTGSEVGPDELGGESFPSR